MQIIKKDKLTIVTEILWLRHNEEHKVNIWDMKRQGQFNYYCKAGANLLPSYGFMQLNATKKILNNTNGGKAKKVKQKKVKLTHAISLGLFVVNALELKKTTADLLICFKVANDQFGYVFIYKGVIFPLQGEFIGDVETVKTKVAQLAQAYNVNNLQIFEDVPFYNDKEFLSSANFIDVVIIKAVEEKEDSSKFSNLRDKFIKQKNKDTNTVKTITYSASNYYLWKNKKIKKIVAKSLIKPIALLQREHRMIMSGIGVVVLCGLLVYLKNIYITEQMAAQSTKLKQMSYSNTVGVSADVLLNDCFADIDSYISPINDWMVTGLECDLHGLRIGYIPTVDASFDFISQELTKKLLNANLAIDASQKTATLTKSFNLTKLHPQQSTEKISDQLEQLQAYSNQFDFKYTLNGEATVKLESNVSPIFLYNNKVINNINILKISMQTDDVGLFHWVIQGDLNGKL